MPPRDSHLGRMLDVLPADERYPAALDVVRGETARLIGMDTADVDPERPYRDYGYDSMAAVLLTDLLSGATGLELPATMLFDHPSPAAVARHLLDRVAPADADPTAAPGVTASAVPDGTAPAPQTAPGDDVIAVVGMACRYPGGVGSAAELWDLVNTGADAVTGFPTDRGWDLDTLFGPDPDVAGTSVARGGGFLAGVADFDAAFFGIGEREATAMDPQARLLLEGVWEALEHAGIEPGSLRGGDTGVFVGACTSDYAQLTRAAHAELDGYWALNTAGSVLSGRVAYTLGVVGPTLTVDTACSSSLVAVHLAAQALRRGECSLAVTGGVAVTATPFMFTEFSRQQALSPDGRCRSFAEDADGTGWAEGVGVLVLERLADARRNGHRVLALVRGSAVNSDGASNGLTAPNGPAQERVIRSALADAALSGADVDVVEAHGTGTVLGDPIEAGALQAAYGGERAQPLWLGSLKSNIGHAQAAAGIAGVIKMIMAMRNGRMPATLHADPPTTKVDWSLGAVRLLTRAREWPRTDRPRRAGVSAFGVGGTNAHIVLEQLAEADGQPGPTPDPPAPGGPVVWAVSAKSAAALGAQLRRLRDHVAARPEVVPLDVGRSLQARTVFDHRAAVVGSGRDELLAGLDAVMDARQAEPSRPGRVAFVFPGQGAQWDGMAAALLDSAPVFAERMHECAAALDPLTGWSLMDVVTGRPGSAPPDRVDVVQPTLFAVMVSLAALWASHGVRPDGVVGHSQGEIAAACVAGALSLPDAARVVAARSRLLAEHVCGRGGGMATVGEPVERVRRRLLAWPERVWLAADNGPASVTVSGELAALAELVGACEADGVRARMVRVDFASHTPWVTPLRDDLLAALAGLTPGPGRARFHSTVDDRAVPDAGYWYRNLREPVRLRSTVAGLLDQGYATFVEISPHPVLAMPLEQAGITALPTLHRGDGSWTDFLRSAALVHTAGVAVDWTPVFDGRDAHRIELPPYAFDRRRYWVEPRAAAGDVAPAGLEPGGHPLLGSSVALAGGGRLATGRWSVEDVGWLADHAVFGEVVVAGAALVELAAAVGARHGLPVVRELTLETPLVVGARPGVDVQVWVGDPDGDETAPLTIHSRPCGADGWIRHAAGTAGPADEPLPGWSATSWPPHGGEEIAVDDRYAALRELGLAYGPAFRGLQAAWWVGDELYAEVRGPADGSFAVHPGTMDACLHAALGDEVVLPFAWSGVRFGVPATGVLRVRLRTPARHTVSMLAVDTAGNPVLSVDSLVARPVRREDLAAAPVDREPYGLTWIAVRPSGVPAADPAVLGPRRWPGARHYGDPAALAADVDSGAIAPEWVVLVVDGPETAGPERVRALTGRALGTVQEWLDQDLPARTRLAVVTRGAVPVAGEDVDPASAAVWGLLRSAQSENPGRFVLVDLPGEPEPAAVRAALAADEPQTAVRDGVAHAPRLVRVPVRPRPVFETDGTVLVTGGTTGLGARCAEHVVREHGVRHLLLTSRRGAETPGVEDLVRNLTALGARVRVEACDVSDRAALARLLDTARPPVRGVLHSAGALDDGVLSALDGRRLDRVLAPKADAAWHLHELLGDVPVFALFSSVSAVLGGPGQANYAAANAFLDGLAAHRRHRGLVATSLGWGFWEQGTELTGHLDEADRAGLAELGVRPMPTGAVLHHLDAALSGPQAYYCTAHLSTAGLTGDTTPPVLHGLLPAGGPAARPVPEATLAARLAELPEPDRFAQVLEVVLDAVHGLVDRTGAGRPEPGASFNDLGLDSLIAIRLRNHLARCTGLTLSPTLVFDHPTPAAVVAHLLAGLSPGEAVPGGTAGRDEGAELRAVDELGVDELLARALHGVPGGST